MIALLRRHGNFRLLWTGETISQVGNSVTTVVMPLIAVTILHSSAFTVSLLRAAAWLPWLGMGLVVGAWIDRLPDQRRLMIVCDLVAAAVFASVPLAWWLGDLTVIQLLVVALIAGGVSVLFVTAYSVFVIDVVSAPDRPAGNSALQGSASAANVVGPGLGGLLVDVLGATTALLADALSFLVSAVCLLVMRRPERPPRPPAEATSLVHRAREGLRYLRDEPLLRPLTLFGATANLALSGYQAILVVFLVREAHLHAAEVGLVLALGGFGGISGAFIAGPLSRRLGSARALLVTKVGGCSAALLIPLATSPDRAVFAVAGGILVGAGIIAGNIITTTFVQGYVPSEIYARTSATNNVVNYGTIPLGALLGGALAGLLGLTPALWITTALVPFGGLFLVLSPLSHMRDLPTRRRPPAVHV